MDLRLGVSYDYLVLANNPQRVAPLLSLTVATPMLSPFISPTNSLRNSARILAPNMHGQVLMVCCFRCIPAILPLSGTATPPESYRVMALTETLQYDLWKNVLTRLEFRWDHQADGFGRAYGGTPNTTQGKRNNFILAANVIYKF